MWMLAVLVACRGEEIGCGPGTQLEDDGLCHAEEVPVPDPGTLEALIAGQPPCEPGEGDGALDLHDGCAGDVCAGSTVEDMVDALGDPECTARTESIAGATTTYFDCVWPTGERATLYDFDGDGMPDPGTSAYGLTVAWPYVGRTEDGVGLGSPMRCYVDRCETLTHVAFGRDFRGDWRINEVTCSAPRFVATDTYVADGAWVPDGLVEAVTMYPLIR